MRWVAIYTMTKICASVVLVSNPVTTVVSLALLVWFTNKPANLIVECSTERTKTKKKTSIFLSKIS